MVFQKFCLWLVVIFALIGGNQAFAGGGPENVCLVVNPDSPDSLAIANHYAQLRFIPARNVVYIPWNPDVGSVDIDAFRTQILRPILKTLDDRKLGGQIDCIVYSSGYPWIVNFASETNPPAKDASNPTATPMKWPKMLGTQGSLTGLTYLYPYVLNKNPGFASPSANLYMRPVVGGRQTLPTMGFRGTYEFDRSGQLVSSGGERYLLSTILAVTPGEKRFGLTAAEAIANLSRSAKADETAPAGKVYFTRTEDPRAKQRAPGYPPAQDALDQLGIPTEVVNTTMPRGKNNVLGLTCGTPSFDWVKTGSTLLPGALCDNLTSSGGAMANKGQTHLSEFLRHGAAGACGTVVEPYLILAKFPSPMLHAHYVRGCSMAEAFYQSIQGPYQQLIMGDALCQPFARIPVVSVPQIKPGQKIRGTLTLRPEARIPPKKPFQDPNAKVSATETSAEQAADTDDIPETVDHFELFVDGVRTAVAQPGEPLTLDTTTLGDGYHELRTVAVGPAPIFTQGRSIAWIVTENHGRSITATTPSPRIPAGGTVTVTAQSPGAKRIEVRQNGRTLGTIEGASGKVTLPASKLGRGMAYLQVVGIGGDKPEEQAFARPIVLWVE